MKTVCPQCHKITSIPEGYDVQEMKCPKCQIKFKPEPYVATAKRTAISTVSTAHKKDRTMQKGGIEMHIVALICLVLLIVGCFLPWLQLGALFANRGIDNPDGAIVLVLAIITGSVALFNVTKNQSRLRGLYILTALVGIGVGIFDLQEVHNRAQEVAKSFDELQSFFGGDRTVDIWNFVGSGLYVILFSSIVLLVVGILSFSKKQTQIVKDRSSSGEVLCIECGNYFSGEPRFCPRCGKKTKFNK